MDYHESQAVIEAKKRTRECFANRLRELRTQIGVNTVEFSKALGITRTAVAYYESGERMPDITTLSAISELTGCNVAYLLGSSDVKYKSPLSLVDALKLDANSDMNLRKLFFASPSFRAFLVHPDTYEAFKWIDACTLLGYGTKNDFSDDVVRYTASSKLSAVLTNIYEKNLKNPVVGSQLDDMVVSTLKQVQEECDNQIKAEDSNNQTSAPLETHNRFEQYKQALEILSQTSNKEE